MLHTLLVGCTQSAIKLSTRVSLIFVGTLGVNTVERGTDHFTSLRAVYREYVERYLHIPHAPFSVRAYRTEDTFTFTVFNVG